MPNYEEGVPPGVQRWLCRWAVLRAIAEQEAEIFLRVHGWLFLRGRGGEGGQVRLYPVHLLSACPWGAAGVSANSLWLLLGLGGLMSAS